jgi:hypothetical protein
LPRLARERISLADNAFSGSLPAVWASDTLVLLDLSSNNLTGTLPAGWGGAAVFPALRELRLEGNSLRGQLPMPQWTDRKAFGAAPVDLVPRPGNPAICGALPAACACVCVCGVVVVGGGAGRVHPSITIA